MPWPICNWIKKRSQSEFLGALVYNADRIAVNAHQPGEDVVIASGD